MWHHQRDHRGGNKRTLAMRCLRFESLNLAGSKHFQKMVPPSAPERTFQASGQGQAIARLKGGLPCCSVPESTTRCAAKRRHAAAEETQKKEKR